MSLVFTQIFGGSPLTAAQPTFLSLNPLTTNVTLSWPLEQTPAGVNVVSDIIEVNATSAGLSISLTDARQTSTGYTAIFNNIGANTFTVLDASGNTLMAVTSGTVWFLYLADNSTLTGTWRVFQFGAGTSSANATALAGAGLKAITTTLNERIVVNAQSANYVIVNGDRASCIEWTGGNGTFTLPSPGVVQSDWFCIVKNAGTGTLTVTPPSGTIDTQASLAFAPDNSAFIVCDGTNFFTIGLGQSINSIFDFVSIDVSGSGDFVLAGANLNRISYRFTGSLTGNRNIVVPNTVQQYWVDNETTGAFTLTVKTAAGTGVSVSQGARNILYCDGTNVVVAVSFGSTGFGNGSAFVPSIFFAASPSTGLYSPGTNQIAATTNGTERLSIDAAGHITLFSADDTTAPTLLVQSPSSAPGVAARITSPFSSSAASPLLHLQSTGGGGFATLSLSGNNGVPGTNDLALFQNGSTLDSTILNRANAALNIGTNGSTYLAISATGSGTITTPTSGVALAISGVGGAYAQTITSTATPGQSLGLEILAGTNATDHALLVNNRANTATFLQINGDGSSSLGWTGAHGALATTSTGAIQGFGPVAVALVDMTPDSGTFVGVATGMTTTVNYNCTWSRIGKLVMLTIGGANGTSNSTSFTMTGLPAAIQPATSSPRIALDPWVVFDNGGNLGITSIPEAIIAPLSGTITFTKGGLSSGWTNTGTKGIVAGATILISYLLS